ncbi:hypothetical protein Syun_017349 [Stephania yunnanensis]|uniref:Uncharacterized protein n=1 Tax=Stephania yunnanensis TaxID=152371 RepID=A0AAP0J937_9MAGN
MQLRVEFSFGEKPEKEYCDNEKLVSEKEVDGILLLRNDSKVDLIFFKEDSDDLDKGPKFDNDEHDFVEDKVNFVVRFSDDDVKPIFEDKVVPNQKYREKMKIQSRIFSNRGRIMKMEMNKILW